MVPDINFLLIGNSRLHWAKYSQNQSKFFHTKKDQPVPKKYEIPTKDFLINTEEAIIRGVFNSLNGVINSTFNPFEDILITCGGASEVLTRFLKTKKKNIINVPNLVMEGMIIHYLSLRHLL